MERLAGREDRTGTEEDILAEAEDRPGTAELLAKVHQQPSWRPAEDVPAEWHNGGQG